MEQGVESVGSEEPQVCSMCGVELEEHYAAITAIRRERVNPEDVNDEIREQPWGLRTCRQCWNEFHTWLTQNADTYVVASSGAIGDGSAHRVIASWMDLDKPFP